MSNLDSALDAIFGASGDGVLSPSTTAPSAKPATKAEKPMPRPVEPWRPFPVHALPEPVRSFVKAVADATGTDPSFAALAALVVIAGCIGNRVAVLVKSGWIEPAVLWGVLVGMSGSVKSPVLKLMTRVIYEMFKSERTRYRSELESFQREMEHHVVRLAEWKRSQRKGPATDPPVEPEAPVERRVIVSDVTVEKLGELLEDNPLGVLLVRDELSAWIGSFDRYAAGGKGSDCPNWLSMYDAAPVCIDRKSGRGSIFVEHAAVSVLGTIQPGTLERCFGGAEREAGLLARVLLACPPQRPALWTDAELPDDLVDIWRNLLVALLALPPGVDDGGTPRPRLIPIGHDALPVFIAWHDRHARESVEVGDGDLAAHFSKLKGACARLALLFTCVEVAAGGKAVSYVTDLSVRRAVEVVEWFKSEARRLYGTFGESDAERDRRKLLAMVSRKGGSVSGRELVQSNRKYANVADAEAALHALVEAGLGSWETPPQRGPGGPKARRFKLDPAYNVCAYTIPADDSASGDTVGADSVGAGADDDGWGVIV